VLCDRCASQPYAMPSINGTAAAPAAGAGKRPPSQNGAPPAAWLAGSPMDPCAVGAEPLPPLPGFPFLHREMTAVISGPTGKGRSSLIQACAYDAARGGVRVAYLGGEVTEPEFNARAALLTERRLDDADEVRDALSRARYLDLHSTLALAWKNPERWVTEVGALYDVVIVDPLNDALAAAGLGHENVDYIGFHTKLMEPLRTHGVAVVMLDNIGHAEDAQGRPMGASAKMHKADLMFSCTAQDDPSLLRLTATKVRSVRAAFGKGATWECDEATQTLTGIDAVFAPASRQSRVERRRDEERGNILHALSDAERGLRELERLTGIAKSTLRRRLRLLEEEGLAQEGEQGWRKGGPVGQPRGVGPLDHPPAIFTDDPVASQGASVTHLFPTPDDDGSAA